MLRTATQHRVARLAYLSARFGREECGGRALKNVTFRNMYGQTAQHAKRHGEALREPCEDPGVGVISRVDERRVGVPATADTVFVLGI